MKLNKKKTGAVAAVVAAMTLFSGCGVDVPSDLVAVHVGDGPFEDKKPKGCVTPGTRDNSITNDTYALFPNSEREWDATGQDGSDSGRFTAVTNDNVEMYVPVTIRFTLKTDCDTLTEFYLRYARRYGVEFDTDGKYNGAWLTTLRKLVRDPADATLDRIIQNYDWRDVWNDPATKVELEKAMNDKVDDLIDSTAKGDYFDGVNVLIGKPEPKNKDLATAVASEQTKVAEAQSAEAQASADKAKALAQVAVAEAEAAKKNAEIDGYGGIDGYLRNKAVENGLNPWQPTVIAPGVTQK